MPTTLPPTTNPFGPNTNPTGQTSWTGPYTGQAGPYTGLPAGTSGTGTPSPLGYTGFDPLLIFAIVIGCVAVLLTILIVICLVCWCNKRGDRHERKERIILENHHMKKARYKNRIIDNSPIIQNTIQPPVVIPVPPAYSGPPPVSFQVFPDYEPTQTVLTDVTQPATPMKFTVSTPDVTKTTAAIVQCEKCGIHKSSANLVFCDSCGGGLQRTTANLLKCEQCGIHKSTAALYKCDHCGVHKSGATLVNCSPAYGGMSTAGSCQTGNDANRYSHVERVGCARSSDAKQLHSVDDCGCSGRSVMKSGNTTLIHNHQY